MAAARKPATKTATKAPAKPRTRKPAASAKASAPEAAAPAKAPAPKAAAAPKRAAAPKASASKAAARKPAASKAAAPAPSVKRRFGLISAITLGVVAAGSAAAYAIRRLLTPGNAEHEAPDLALDAPRPSGVQRAPDAFRPDPTAEVPASERDGLRPATGPLPSLVRH